MAEPLDVLVVGAGQAGLALGYYLKKQGLRFLIVDGAGEIGSSWAQRWDSLTLFTPAECDSLPGLRFPGRAGTYPGKDEVAAYLRDYVQAFDLPVQTGRRVLGLRREGSWYLARTEHEVFAAEQVVVATGPFQEPFVPEFGRQLAPGVFQLHGSAYKNPGSLPPGEVLVVGAGNSGMQIAEELAAARKVTLSQGRPLPIVPRRILGRSLFWWLETLGLMKVNRDSAFGRRMMANDEVVIGARPSALVRAGRLTLVPRAVRADGNTVVFADGRSLEVSTVLWATGYRPDFGWIELPVFDERGQPVHRQGVTAAPGLYFLGLRWQHTTGSALLGWVGRDAAYIAGQVGRARQRA